MRTAMLLTPSLEEVRLAAAKMGLPDMEAQKFWNYYESQGWRVGKVRMVSFTNALAGWNLRWQERNGHGDTPKVLTGADKLIHRDEYNRIEARITLIRHQYDQNIQMSNKDREEIKRLKARREELQKMLNIVI